MPRLIEVDDASKCLSPLRLRTGELLLFHASGGRIESGNDVIKMMGPFITAVIGENGSILTPECPPNTVAFLAQKNGSAVISLITGALWHSPQATRLEISVES